MDLKTDIAKVKGMGSAKTGTHHWLQQRITAIFLFVCSLWLIYFVKFSLADVNLQNLLAALQNPYNIVPLSILVIISIYHALLGMRVVIEDYIHCAKLKTILIIFLQFICLITIIAFIVGLAVSYSIEIK